MFSDFEHLRFNFFFFLHDYHLLIKHDYALITAGKPGGPPQGPMPMGGPMPGGPMPLMGPPGGPMGMMPGK